MAAAMKRGKKMARTVSTVDINGVKARVINVSKKLETPTGRKIERKATVQVRVFDSYESLLEAYGADAVFTMAQSGIGFRARQIANNALMSAGLDKDGRALLKSFRTHLDTLVNIMDIPKDEAVKTLLAKDNYKSLESTLASLEKDEPTVFDYTATPVPLPTDDDEAEDDTDEPTA